MADINAEDLLCRTWEERVNERSEWMDRDPDTYWAVARLAAERAVEDEMARERDRRARTTRDRIRHYLHLLVGALGRRP